MQNLGAKISAHACFCAFGTNRNNPAGLTMSGAIVTNFPLYVLCWYVLCWITVTLHLIPTVRLQF
jgi:hypothetical protein